MQSKGSRRIFLRIFIISLHSIFVGQFEELINGFIKLFSVLQAPRPLFIEVLAEVKPRDPAVLVELPALHHLGHVLLRQVRHLAQYAIVISQLVKQPLKLFLRLDTLLVFVELSPEDLLDCVLLPVVKSLFLIATAELVLVLLLLGGHGDALVLAFLVEVGSLLLLESLLLLLQGLELVHFSVQVALTLAEGLPSCRLDDLLFLLSGVSSDPGVFSLPELVGLESLLEGDDMTVEQVDLRHGVYDLEPIVGLLSQGIPVQIQLFQEGEVSGKKLKELVEVAKLVISY